MYTLRANVTLKRADRFAFTASIIIMTIKLAIFPKTNKSLLLRMGEGLIYWASPLTTSISWMTWRQGIVPSVKCYFNRGAVFVLDNPVGSFSGVFLARRLANSKTPYVLLPCKCWMHLWSSKFLSLTQCRTYWISKPAFQGRNQLFCKPWCPAAGESDEDEQRKRLRRF